MIKSAAVPARLSSTWGEAEPDKWHEPPVQSLPYNTDACHFDNTRQGSSWIPAEELLDRMPQLPEVPWIGAGSHPADWQD